MKSLVVFFFLVLSAFSVIEAQGSRQQDSLALVALYNSTDGTNWTVTWDLERPMEEWFGVGLNANGRVICLESDGCDVSSTRGNDLSGTIPIELGNLFFLERLNLSNNDLVGVIPASIGQLTNLKILDLGRNELQGNIISELRLLTNLESLDLHFNQLSGSIPTWLNLLSNISSVDLSSNELEGDIPAELGELSRLRWLDLRFNNLTGTIPTTITQRSLKYLLLNDNQLTGEIPANICNLTNLDWLYLSDNQLTGEIPNCLFQIAGMSELLLGDNNFSGTIPSIPNKDANYLFLTMNNCGLSGSIPAELGSAANYYLDLSDNELTGSIPQTFGQSYLTFLYVENNNLSGCYPPSFANACEKAFRFSNNPDLPNGGDFAAFCANQTGICVPEEVWPGDTNADGIVDADDRITLIRQHTLMGSARSNASFDWTGQPMTDWGITNQMGVDAKHADCNGDGLVDRSTDSPGLQQNYGRGRGDQFMALAGNLRGDLVLRSQWNNVVANPTTVSLDLILEQLGGTATDFFAVAFTLDYSPTVAQIAVTTDNSVLGANADIFLQPVGTGQIDIVLTETAGLDVSTADGNQQLARLHFTLPNPTADALHLKFHNIKIVNFANDRQLSMLGSTATIKIPSEGNIHSSANSKNSEEFNLVLNANFIEECSSGAIAYATPINGIPPYTFEWSNGTTDATAEQLPQGWHELTVIDATNRSVTGSIEIFGRCEAAALAVRFVDFYARPSSTFVTLEWGMVASVGNYPITVQRSVDGINFKDLHRAMTNKAVTNYRWYDERVQTGQRYYYRLRINENGKISYSPVRTAQLRANAALTVQIQPNPFQEEFVIKSPSFTTSQTIQVKVHNVLGQVVNRQSYTPFSNEISIHLAEVDSGIYWLTLLNGNQQETLKIIKQ